MNSDVTAVLNRLAPVHTTKKRICKNPASELSPEAIEAKRLRRRCEKKFRKTKSNLDRLAYRRAVRVVNQLIIASAQESNQKRLNDAAGDQKLLWKISNSILHRRGEPDDCCDPIQQSNLCTSFKNFFINKILKIRRDIAARLSSISSAFSNLSLKCSVFFNGFLPVSVDEVASIINSTKCKSSPIDTIPTVVLKRCVDIFAPSLAHLANLSFSAGVFPDKFKLGHVIPLLIIIIIIISTFITRTITAKSTTEARSEVNS